MIEKDWPDVQYLRAFSRQSAEWNKCSEVVPIFSRTPYGDWCSIFMDLAGDDELIDWKSAGFARCLHEEVEFLSSRLAVITGLANRNFRDFLSRGLSRANSAQENRHIADLIKIEATLAAGEVGNGSTCSFF